MHFKYCIDLFFVKGLATIIIWFQYFSASNSVELDSHVCWPVRWNLIELVLATSEQTLHNIISPLSWQTVISVLLFHALRGNIKCHASVCSFFWVFLMFFHFIHALFLKNTPQIWTQMQFSCISSLIAEHNKGMLWNYWTQWNLMLIQCLSIVIISGNQLILESQ